MKRLHSPIRSDWRRQVEGVGLTYHTHDTPGGAKPYWDESVCYELTAGEIDVVEKAIKELHDLLIDVADSVVERGAWDLLAIPESAVPLVETSWNRDDFSLYGRFDLGWAPGGTPQLLEYNADTPTSLVEAAVAQWYWLQEVHPGRDQFNSIHERLIEAWKRYRTQTVDADLVDFLSVENNLEDEQTVSYLMDTAQQAGLKTRWSAINAIGYDQTTQYFVTSANNRIISSCFKLYPWEWMFHEEFGGHLKATPVSWIEPPWKTLLSNKAILAIAWQKYPNHPNLLPCYFDAFRLGSDYVKKPKLSREGANITVIKNGTTLADTSGDYGEEGFVYQAIADIPVFEGKRPIFGGWVIDHEAAGMGIRESDGLVTDNVSRFVPHFIS